MCERSPCQVLVLVEVLEEGGLTDELLLLTHLLTGASRLSQLHLQGAEGGPHHLAVAEVLGGRGHTHTNNRKMRGHRETERRHVREVHAEREREIDREKQTERERGGRSEY